MKKVFIRMIWQNLLGVGWKKIWGCGAKFWGRVANHLGSGMAIFYRCEVTKHLWGCSAKFFEGRVAKIFEKLEDGKNNFGGGVTIFYMCEVAKQLLG